IRSPIEGIVLEKNIAPDEYVKRGEGKPLFRIAASKWITAVVQLPEHEALLVKRDNRATGAFDALEDNRVIAGKVSRIAYSIDPATRTLRAEVALPNAEGRLRPGMVGTSRIVVGEVPDVLSVPNSALINARAGEATCIRIVNGRTA